MGKPPASAPQARYVIGTPYRMGGVWSYPREDFALVETGYSVVVPDTRSGRITADGEAWDPGAPLAAHRTLQLPAILRVTALKTGRSLDLRVIDRGPVEPGRILGLSR
ncbi:MAG TPA: RlpA-like double-psi beta-barrel domain-containing protein, partial [Crenalkalicoccus sp.]|nr:RlpA-like double-psi beta-barrel domain-containing protein [Crenalkalicoccus sp.]